MTKLESLANELLLDLFEYFDGIHLLNGFYDLNHRFNQLLLHHFHNYSFDFRSVSKRHFNLACREYLPLVIDRIVSLHLSDDDETPKLPELFLSQIFTFEYFIYLKSLSFYCLRSLDLLNQIIIQCRQLSSLTRLNIINFYVDYEENIAVTLMNNIWSLNLIHCHLDNFYSGGRCFSGIETVCTTMEYLSIENIYCDLTIMYHLFQYTPNLRQLSTASDYCSDDQSIYVKGLLVNKFELSFEGSIQCLTNLLQHMPNLCSLTLKTSDIKLNGYQFEEIFRKYLTKLKVFRLKMNFHFDESTDKNRQIDELLDTYRTEFWLEQHRWFVQCDWDPHDVFDRVILYTLPYAFNDFLYIDTIQSQSTASNQLNNSSYDRVNTLRYCYSSTVPTLGSMCKTCRFDRICRLKLHIPCRNSFWLNIPTLNYLKYLEVTIHDESSLVQLQSLLNRVPHLYSLTIRSALKSPITLAQMKSDLSIRRLDLMTKSAVRLRYFTTEECHLLIHSSLIEQCEVLLISVENRMVICDIVKTMTNLRALTFQCQDDKWNYCDLWATGDELVRWLIECFPSTFFIARDKTQTSKIHLWIR
ncbi:unnamed protein product [Adineta ricciae]|uniref:Uncharacterized protein n=1 Tax=Adineta ricciae TaxID=249248 RepID=A0A815KLP2_ADIRI|nr:unnamed protein product [Adineta ricciae]